MADLFIGIGIGLVLFFFLECVKGGGGFAIKGTKKYDKYNRDADRKVKNILKNGTGSSKADLQKWWNSNHK
jgi:hypothetical protein